MRKPNGEFARDLRKRQTDAENRLWYFLRNRNFMSLKFRRQYPLPPYVADFYCAEKQLIIELDGGQHAEQSFYDQQRTDFFQKHGITVLRFWNNEVLAETNAVLEQIRLTIENCPSPQPSPHKYGERGALFSAGFPSPRLRGEG